MSKHKTTSYDYYEDNECDYCDEQDCYGCDAFEFYRQFKKADMKREKERKIKQNKRNLIFE